MCRGIPSFHNQLHACMHKTSDVLDGLCSTAFEQMRCEAGKASDVLDAVCVAAFEQMQGAMLAE